MSSAIENIKNVKSVGAARRAARGVAQDLKPCRSVEDVEMGNRPMRDSGIAWIGQVPREWKVLNILYALRSPISDGPHETPTLIDDGIPFVSIDSLNDSESVDFSVVKKFISEEEFARFSLRTKLEQGDVLFSKAATIGKTAIVGVEHYMVWSPLAILKPDHSKLITKYLYYVVNCDGLVFEARMSGSQNTQVNVGMRELEKVKMPLPPLPEQRAIAAYLDRECGRIDGLRAKIECQIEKLGEYKKSLITEAVTGKKVEKVGGSCSDRINKIYRIENDVQTENPVNPVNPVASRQMRDSGVAWIGQVPKGWKISKVKYEVENLDNLREPISAEKRINEYALYDYYGASGVIDKIDDYNVDETVLLIGEDGANLRMRNLPLIYRASGRFWVNNHAHILRIPAKNDYAYFAHMLECGDYTDFITGAAQPKLSQENLNRFPIPLPPLAEQRAIAEFLDEKCGAIDAMVGKCREELERLAEYKKSLIFECVTGKRAVQACS